MINNIYMSKSNRSVKCAVLTRRTNIQYKNAIAYSNWPHPKTSIFISKKLSNPRNP